MGGYTETKVNGDEILPENHNQFVIDFLKISGIAIDISNSGNNYTQAYDWFVASSSKLSIVQASGNEYSATYNWMINSGAKYSDLYASGNEYTKTYEWMVNSGSQYTNILESGTKYTQTYTWFNASAQRISEYVDSGNEYSTAYTHSQDNSQAHSDYLINTGDDDTSGTLTAKSFVGPISSTAMSSASLKVGATRVTTILDEDAMGSDSATALATQQSIKAYTDTLDTEYTAFSSNSRNLFAHSSNINSRFVASGTQLVSISSQKISGGTIVGGSFSGKTIPNTHFTIKKEGDDYVGYSPSSEKLASNTNFATVCQTVVNNLTYSGSSYLLIENPGTWINVDSTITVSGNGSAIKDAIIDGGMSQFGFGGLNGPCFSFWGKGGQQRTAVIKNCMISGDAESTNQSFACFHNIRAYADNISTGNQRYVYRGLVISGASYLGEIKNCFIHAKIPIDIRGYTAGSNPYEANGFKIYNCNLGYSDSYAALGAGCGIKINMGIGIGIYNNWFEGSVYGISGQDVDHIRILGNHFGGDDSLQANIYLPDGYFQQISNNYFALAANDCDGIYWDDSYNGGNITNNTVYAASRLSGVTFVHMNTVVKYNIQENDFHIGAYTSGIAFVKADGTCNEGVVSNNIIHADGIGLAVDGPAAINIPNGNDISIINNSFKNFTKPINVTETNNNIIKLNLEYPDNKWTHISSQAISGGAIITASLSSQVIEAGTIICANQIGINNTTPDYDLDVNGSIYGTVISGGNLVTTSKVKHAGDPNTSITFTDDNMTLVAGGEGMLKLYEGAGDNYVLANYLGVSDMHFGVSGNDDILIWADPTTDRVGIKTKTPAYDLDVNGTIHATAFSSAAISGGQFTSRLYMVPSTTEPTKTIGTLWMSGSSSFARLYMISGDTNPIWKQFAFTGE